MNQEGDVKLCDFGHSNKEDPTSNTPYIVQRFYRAPEIICETTDNNKTNGKLLLLLLWILVNYQNMMIISCV